MTSFHRILAAAALGLGLCGNAAAASTNPDFTDVWWNPTENGWGINIVQGGPTLFATMFVYGVDNTNRWLIASNLASLPASAGQSKFGGALYQTNGTYFGTVPYNPGQFVPTEVGTMTITFDSANTGTVVYTVGPLTVSKNISRLTLGTNNPVGIFVGGISTLTSNCKNTADNTKDFTVPAYLVVTANGGTTNYRFDYSSTSGTVSCNYAGSYAQNGRLGSMSGNWSCVNSTSIVLSGTYQLTEIDVQQAGITGKLVATDPNTCTFTGTLGGIRNSLQQ